jgi:hypothetical protein
MPQHWDEDEPVKPMTVRWAQNSHTTALVFQDIDGDGWLDLVLGRVQGERTLWVHYGPLRDSFQTMSDQGFDLDQAWMTEKAKQEKP